MTANRAFLTVAATLLLTGGCADNGVGFRGESCEQRADCQVGLACLGGTCVVDQKGLSFTGNVCETIQCEANTDCDDNFTCQDQLCFPSCTDNFDCFGSICSDGICVQCANDGDCGDGERCVNQTCYNECSNSNECPIFFACNAGLCELEGCNTNEECIFLFSDSTAVCDGDAICRIGCEADFHCGGLAVCSGGMCVNAGCNDEIECKAQLYPNGLPSNILRLECNPQEENNDPVYTDARTDPIFQ